MSIKKSIKSKAVRASLGILARDEITLTTVIDVQGIYRYFILATETPEKPMKYPPAEPWQNVEPDYELGNQDNLYYIDCTLFSDTTYKYGEVQKSSDYEAVKQTYDDAMRQLSETESRLSIENAETKDSVLQTVSEEYFSKEDADNRLGEISTSIEQTKNSFEMKFNNIQANIDANNKDTTDKFQQIESYIRFENGSIVLGEKGSELVLTIENDRISFKQNGLEVAYFSNNKMNVTDAEVGHKLRIGNFMFSPRPDGSLDFKKASDI